MFGWEVNDDDVFMVLKAHGKADSIDDKIVEQAYRVTKTEERRVMESALRGIDLDDQTDAANSAIEDILMEKGVIEKGKKRFPRS